MNDSEKIKVLREALEQLLAMPACCNTDPEVVENVERREKAKQVLEKTKP